MKTKRRAAVDGQSRMSADAGGVAAVDRALKILDALIESDPEVSLAELSKRTGLFISTLLRLARSLERFGYLLRSDEGTYRLGSKGLVLGSLYQRHFRTVDFVPPVLSRIVADLHEGASFYIREENNRVCLHRVEARRTVRDYIHEGDRLPLTVGAAGHVLLAFTGQPGERYDRIRDEMYAASFGERDPEIAAVACPVFRLNQEFVGALSVSGPRYRIESLGVNKILPALFKHAQDLTRTLGGNPFAPEFRGWILAPEPGAPALGHVAPSQKYRAPAVSKRTSAAQGRAAR